MEGLNSIGTLDISVVIICNRQEKRLKQVINAVQNGTVQKEIILVLSVEMAGRNITAPEDNIRVILSKRQGRGYACYEGARVANGRIILFLHADTVLPMSWDRLVLESLQDKKRTGGGFSITYDSNNWFLRNVSPYINLYSKIFKEIWGDRGIFIEKQALMPYLDALQVPIMEDIKLSRIIHLHGKMVILHEPVVTSADHFRSRGYWNHILSILLFRILYAFGVSEGRIYQWYYGIELKEFPTATNRNKPILK